MTAPHPALRATLSPRAGRGATSSINVPEPRQVVARGEDEEDAEPEEGADDEGARCCGLWLELQINLWLMIQMVTS